LLLIVLRTASYDTAASRYHPAVYQRKRADLVTTIHTTLHPLFYSQLKNLSKLTLARFKKALGDGLKGNTTYDFAEVVGKAKESGLSEWEKGTKDMLKVVGGDGGEWAGPWEEEKGVLITELGHVADVFRKDETTKMVNQIEVSFVGFFRSGLPFTIRTDNFGFSSARYERNSRSLSKSL
jgi:hypothetical protein